MSQAAIGVPGKAPVPRGGMLLPDVRPPRTRWVACLFWVGAPATPTLRGFPRETKRKSKIHFGGFNFKRNDQCSFVSLAGLKLKCKVSSFNGMDGAGEPEGSSWKVTGPMSATQVQQPPWKARMSSRHRVALFWVSSLHALLPHAAGAQA